MKGFVVVDFLFSVTPIVGICNCSMFCCALLYVHSSMAIILMGKRERELVAVLNFSSWCLVMVERLFLTVPWGCLRFVIVVFPVHTPLIFLAPILKIASTIEYLKLTNGINKGLSGSQDSTFDSKSLFRRSFFIRYFITI